MKLLLALILGFSLTASAQRPMIEQLPDLLTMYAPSAERGESWKKIQIENPSQWEQKAKDIRQRTLDIMGRFPSSDPPLEARVEKEEILPKYVRRKVSYQSATGDRIPAWLLIPRNVLGRCPAVLAAHQTEAGGKDSAVAIGGEPHVRYGHELAELGFVVLAPDSITAGERVFPDAKPYVTAPFDKANPEWSAMGKMCSDHRRGLDYLQTLDIVDPERIGAIGHSLGGYNAYFLAAFDDRVKATVVSCGFTPMGRASKPFAWARETWFVHFPALARYLRAGILPFDFHEVMALVAPRPLFNYSAGQDSIFPDAAAIAAAGVELRQLYRVLGTPDSLSFEMGSGPHGFPEPVRQRAYAWLEKQLSATRR